MSNQIKKKPTGYWNFKQIQLEALKYKTRLEFSKNSGSAYNAARRLGIFEQVCSHMPKKAHYKWSKEKVLEEARKHSSPKEFKKSAEGAYSAAQRFKMLDECNSHMEYINTKGYLHNVYIWKFADNTAYIGETNQLKIRKKQHLKEGSVWKKIKTLLNYEYKILEDGIPKKDVTKREQYWMDFYKNMGWKLLNKNKAGALGGAIKHSKKKIETHLKETKYKNINEFKRKRYGMYQTCHTRFKNEWEIWRNKYFNKIKCTE